MWGGGTRDEFREKNLHSADKRGNDQGAIAPRLKEVPGLDGSDALSGIVGVRSVSVVEEERNSGCSPISSDEK